MLSTFLPIIMQISYNLNCIRAPMTGVGYYTLNMVLAMIQQYPDIDISAFRHNKILSKTEILSLFSEIHREPRKQSSWKKALIDVMNQSFLARSMIQWQQSFRHQLKLKKQLHQFIYHEPNFVFLPHKGKKILTVHDTSMFDCPEFLPKGRAKFLQQQMQSSMKKADALIVSCQFIKHQVLKLMHIDEKKIHVIAPGASENFRPRSANETQTSLDNFSLVYKKFLLCVATLEPRKNISRLIKAYQQLPKDLQKNYPLVLVGNKGWMYQELFTLIQEKASSTIILLRYIDEKTLFHLYSAAKAFIYPSLYEGFGLPILEAMQSGLPIITSNISSLPEVCGDAGILIDPEKEQDISKAIIRLLNASDSDYDSLVNQSIARAKEFSWKRFAEKLFEVYKKEK